MRFRDYAAVAGLLAATVIVAPPASAITLGSVAPTDPGGCSSTKSGGFYIQHATASTSPSYAVPAGGGLITSWSTSFQPAGEPFALLVTTPFTEASTTVVGVDSETVPTPAPSGNVSTFTLSPPIHVQAGDLIGFLYSASSGSRCIFPSSSSSDVIFAGEQESVPPPGSTVTATVPGNPFLVNASANLLQSSDLAVSGAVTPSAVTTGDLANFTFQVTSSPTGLIGTLSDTLPSGLTPVAASSGSGACAITGQGVDCPLSSTPATVNITIRGASPGSYTNTAHIVNPISETTPADNAASVSLGVVNSPPTPRCTVPKLKGVPLSVARAFLRLVNCKVGKVKKIRSKSVRKGNVISTSPKAGTNLAAGAKVAIRSSSGKPKNKAKRKR